MTRRRWGTAGLLFLATATVGGLAPAQAQTSGDATATIPVQQVVRSVTVSPNAVTYGNCAKGGASLTFPNDTCSTPVITVTNTGTAGHVNVHGSDAVPADNGTPWSLVGSAPGQDKFSEMVHDSQDLNDTSLSNTDTCDWTFYTSGTGCGVAAANQSVDETISLEGPASSTDSSSQFSTTITWTAVP